MAAISDMKRLASGDPLATNAEGCGDLAGLAAVGQVQDDGRSLDVMCQGEPQAHPLRPGSTRLEMRLAFDQVQGFGQRLAFEQTEPLAGMAMPGKVEAIPADVFQAGKGCVELRFG